MRVPVTSWSYDRANAGNAVTRSRLRCSIARDCPFGIGFRPPTWSTPGISAVQLQRQLGLRRYETAWGLLQKLRRAMVRPERDRISGEVEVDETYVGGVERWAGARRTKTIVVGGEIRGRDPVESGRHRGSVRRLAGRIPRKSVAPWVVHRRLPPPRQRLSRRKDRRTLSMHRVFSNLKTWLAGTHHGVGEQHLIISTAFQPATRSGSLSVVGLASQHQPTTYHMLYDGESTG